MKLHSFGMREALIPDPGAPRILGLASLVNCFGGGLVLTAMTLFFTRVVHLSTWQVGVGLTLAGAVGLPGAPLIGDLADRLGPREVARTILLIEAAITVCYVFIHSFVPFVIVTSLEVICLTAYVAVNRALIRRVGGRENAAFPNVLAAIGNLAISVGALGCGVAVAIGTAQAYQSLIIINALTFVCTWAILGRLPRYEPLPKPEGHHKPWTALTDKSFVAFTIVDAVISMQFSVIMTPLPLWVVDHTHAPRWIISIFLVINTALVVLLQARVGRNVDTVRRGGAALRRSGVIFLASCSLIGLAAGVPGWTSILLLIGAVTIHTIGELHYTAGSYAVSFGLAPEYAQGQYQGLLGIGMSAASAVSPVLMIGLVLSLGRVGWIGLGLLFALSGLVTPAVVQWGERTRLVATTSPAISN
ncbi:MAG: MFS transporter [Micromonosporaceae bacterium]|nr:MFS transporter [Micromonosporaceae bacterium]